MRTPIDAFHQALLNLAAQKAEAEKPKKVRKQGATGHVGERVVWMPARNLTLPLVVPGDLADRSGRGRHGIVTSVDNTTLYVRMDNGNQALGHIVHWEKEAPLPEFTDLMEVDKWLAS